MIVFTLMYAGLLRPLIGGDKSLALSSPWKTILAIHIGLQVAFTLLVHSRERFARVAKARRWPIVWFAALMLAALGWSMLSRSSGLVLHTSSGSAMTLGEVGYRLFLLMYGTFFPGYALICMLPLLREVRHRQAPKVSAAARRRVFWIASGIAYPLAVMGLIVGPSWWLLGLYGALTAGRVVAEFLPASQAPKTTV